eukprot:scaffold119346_cov48-Phaeocystis_antarctica.AAC.2
MTATPAPQGRTAGGDARSRPGPRWTADTTANSAWRVVRMLTRFSTCPVVYRPCRLIILSITYIVCLICVGGADAEGAFVALVPPSLYQKRHGLRGDAGGIGHGLQRRFTLVVRRNDASGGHQQRRSRDCTRQRTAGDVQ